MQSNDELVFLLFNTLLYVCKYIYIGLRDIQA